MEVNVINMNYESFGVTKNSNLLPLKTSPLPQTFTVSLDYTPGIYAEGYIVFVFPFVCSSVTYVRLFVLSYFCPVRGIASKFYVKVSQVGYISATTHQKAYIFGP